MLAKEYYAAMKDVFLKTLIATLMWCELNLSRIFSKFSEIFYLYNIVIFVKTTGDLVTQYLQQKLVLN